MQTINYFQTHILHLMNTKSELVDLDRCCIVHSDASNTAAPHIGCGHCSKLLLEAGGPYELFDIFLSFKANITNIAIASKKEEGYEWFFL